MARQAGIHESASDLGVDGRRTHGPLRGRGRRDGWLMAGSLFSCYGCSLPPAARNGAERSGQKVDMGGQLRPVSLTHAQRPVAGEVMRDSSNSDAVEIALHTLARMIPRCTVPRVKWN